MSLEERIDLFMNCMHEATKKTGITYAVEHGKNMVLFDIASQNPVELEIVVGTEVKRESGNTSITVFDKSSEE